MTSELTRRAQELTDGITPGPWVLRYDGSTGSLRANTVHAGTRDALPIAHVWLPLPWRGAGGEFESVGAVAERQADANARLIAAVPELVPALLDRLTATEKKLERVQEVSGGYLALAANLIGMSDHARGYRDAMECVWRLVDPVDAPAPKEMD